MARAKRHHYVPQFHLKLFGIGLDPATIWRYDKTLDRILRLKIQDAAVIGNYYTFTTEEGPDDGLERIFSEVEGAAAHILRRLCAETGPRFEIDVADRFTLGMYLGLQHGRVPTTRTVAQQMAEYLRSIELDMRLANPEGFIEEARSRGWEGTDAAIEERRREMLDAMRSGQYRVKADESVSLDSPIIGMRDVAPYIASMGWWLVRRRSFPRYLIGDAPVTVWPSRDHPSFLGVGFATPDAETSVPLDPETTLVMGHNMPDGHVVYEENIPEPQFGAMPWPYHYRQWIRAQRYVFAQSRADLEALQFAMTPADRQRTGARLGKVSGGPPEWSTYEPGGTDTAEAR